jgi:4-hydroxybenzoyl-CoA reductase subunit beta
MLAPGSWRCWAVQSSDTVPVVCALQADVELVGANGTRRIKAHELYRDDGIQYLTKRPEELLPRLYLGPPGNWITSTRPARAGSARGAAGTAATPARRRAPG